MATGAGDRNFSLDWLRAVSILYITGFWHLLNYTTTFPEYHHPVFWRITVLALALFTLISGYLMGRSKPPVGVAGLKDFYIRRVIRLYPPYLLALIIFLVLRLTGRLKLLKGALLLGMILPPSPPTLWFIGMIVLFYVATPPLLALASNSTRYLATVSAATAALWLVSALTPAIDPRLPIYLPVYAAGILLARREPVRVSGAVWLILGMAAAISAALSLGAPTTGPTPTDQSAWMAPYALASSLAVFLLLNGRLPHSRSITWLSYGSFFLYLLNRPIYEVVLRVSGLPDGPARVAVLLGIAFPIAIVAGHGGQSLYDRLVVPRLQRRRQEVSGTAL